MLYFWEQQAAADGESSAGPVRPQGVGVGVGVGEHPYGAVLQARFDTGPPAIALAYRLRGECHSICARTASEAVIASRQAAPRTPLYSACGRITSTSSAGRLAG